MNRGFYTIMAAQFFSSLADNALLIAAIALLAEMQSPEWMTPMLKLFFVVSYVVLAALVGSFADYMPKGRVMFVTNGIKVLGCAMMFAGVHPLLAYAVVGFGAAAYSPAKYGILTELLPCEKLVAANGWIEGLTVSSIILGTVLGGFLISPTIAATLLSIDVPMIHTNTDSPAEAAIAMIAGSYVLAAIFNLRIPDTGVRYTHQGFEPQRLMHQFAVNCAALWRDKLGQISLAVTTLFWGAGATLQFIVIKWASVNLNLPLDRASVLQGVVALGIALGAIVAARVVPIHRAASVLVLGVLMGLLVMLMPFVTNVYWAYPLLVGMGALAGFFVVPMNALLQHRGHLLMSAGSSIAVQNFNENLCILVMLALYAVLITSHVSITIVIWLFGGCVAGVMTLIMLWYRHNAKHHDVSVSCTTTH
jgi:LPLT family lysophospholipid transporter-like MFS transporter